MTDHRVLVFALLAIAAGRASAEDHPPVEYVGSGTAAGTSQAVVVTRQDLVHTAQFFPVGRDGAPVATTVRAQFDAILESVEMALDASGSGLDQLVKLNLYCADDDVANEVRAALVGRFAGGVRPAVTFTCGQLAAPGVFVAMDAVGAAPPRPRKTQPGDSAKPQSGTQVRRIGGDGLGGVGDRMARAAVLPLGGRVDISGQSEPGDPRTATQATLESLRRTLEFMRLDLDSVVQIKTFLHPIGATAEVQDEILRFFGDQAAPPLVFVEWQAPNSLEIELVAASPAGAGPADPYEVEYLTPPGMTASSVFSRATRTRSETLIYVSGLYGDETPGGERQVRYAFGRLESILRQCRSDMRHLAKATYYVTDDDASQALGRVRPEIYDPQRPPAASKASVASTGIPGRTITFDMVAVPVGEGAAPLPYDPVERYSEHSIEGWRILVHSSLRDQAQASLREATLKLLADHLYRITLVVPEAALARLREVPIWVELAHPLHPCMCYHPSAEWLREHGMNPDKAQGVELSNCQNFLSWTREQPWMVFHELAHAYHDRVLGFDHAEVRTEYQRITADETYALVLRTSGRKERHYALVNEQEYFAESSESYFGTNDFFPFVGAELRVHDPRTSDLIGRLWGVKK